jgi:conjugative transfer region protein TrbK
MSMKKLERLPAMAALVLVVLVVAACAIRLRGDEDQLRSVSADQVPDPFATKLAECRSVKYEHKEALSECRKAWAEQRHQFLRQKAPASSDNGASQEGSSLFVLPKDESRISPGYNSNPQAGKE